MNKPSTENNRRTGVSTTSMLLVVALVGVAGFAAWRLFINPKVNVERTVDTFEVERKTFPILLTEKGELEAQRSVDVKCEVEGRSTIIWIIPEGTVVKEGDLLVRLASNEIEERIQEQQIKLQNARADAEAADKELEILLDQNASDIRKAELAVRNAEIDLQKYIEGDYLLELADKDLAVEKGRKLLEQAESLLEDSKKLREQGFLSELEFERDELAAYERRMELQKAERERKVYIEYTHPQELEKKKADLEEAKKELQRTQKSSSAKESQQRAKTAAKHAELDLIEERLNKLIVQRDKTEIHAPADGLVVYDAGDRWRDDSRIAEGSEVYERQSLIQLPDTSSMKAKLRIHEAKTNQISIGQPASVVVDGIPGVTFNGRVSQIAPLADSRNRWLNPDLKEYDTTVLLDPTDRDLKPGMTARASILVDNIENALAVPVQAVYSSGPRRFVFKGPNAETAQPVPVETGEASEEFVEITGGLEEGDIVLLAASDSLLAELPAPTEEEKLDIRLGNKLAQQVEGKAGGGKSGGEGAAGRKGGGPDGGKHAGRPAGGQRPGGKKPEGHKESGGGEGMAAAGGDQATGKPQDADAASDGDAIDETTAATEESAETAEDSENTEAGKAAVMNEGGEESAEASQPSTSAGEEVAGAS